MGNARNGTPHRQEGEKFEPVDLIRPDGPGHKYSGPLRARLDESDTLTHPAGTQRAHVILPFARTRSSESLDSRGPPSKKRSHPGRVNWLNNVSKPPRKRELPHPGPCWSRSISGTVLPELRAKKRKEVAQNERCRWRTPSPMNGQCLAGLTPNMTMMAVSSVRYCLSAHVSCPKTRNDKI